MALTKTNAELRVVETALPEKVVEASGQIVLSDDGKMFYDNTVMGRTRINPDALKLCNTAELGNGVAAKPYTSLIGDSNLITLETKFDSEGWLFTTSPATVSLNGKYYAFIPKTGRLQDKLWKMLELESHPFINASTGITVNGRDYEGFVVRFIYSGDSLPSHAQSFVGEVIKYKATDRNNYFNLVLRLEGRDNSPAAAQAAFESGYAFNTVNVNVLTKQLSQYVTWTGVDLQAIHGYQESATDPITFAAPLQIRNPKTGDIESIQTQEGRYIKFLGFHTMVKAIEIFSNGNDGIIQSTDTIAHETVYAQLAFEPTWISGGELSADTFSMALPLSHKLIDNVTCIYFKVSDSDTESLTSHVSRIISDCGNFCIVEITWDDTKDFELPVDAKDCGIKGIEVAYDVTVQDGQAMWCHSNEYGVRVVEVITDSVILDEVDEEADQPVKSSGIAKYIRDNVAGVYKFKGNIEADGASEYMQSPEHYGLQAGYVYNVTTGGLIYHTVEIKDAIVDVDYTDSHVCCLIWTSLIPLDTDSLSRLILQDSDGGYWNLRVIRVQAPTIGSMEEGIADTIEVRAVPDEFTNTPCDFGQIVDKVSVISVAHSIQLNAGDNIVWNGEQWDKLAGTIDLSGYATKAEVSNIKADLTSVLRYCGTVECGDSVEYNLSSLRIGDVYNVYHKHRNGYGTLNMEGNDVQLIVAANGTATFAGADIETAIGKRRDSANYLKMDVGISTAVGEPAIDYHWVLVPDTNKFEGYRVYDYTPGMTKIPEAGTYIVSKISLHVEEEDNGVNVVWDGVGFDKLGPAVDLTNYVSVRDIESTVNAESDKPVSGKAVDAAIKSAVSSVYKPIGSYTCEYLSIGEFPQGSVANVIDSGVISSSCEPALSNYIITDITTDSEGIYYNVKLDAAMGADFAKFDNMYAVYATDYGQSAKIECKVTYDSIELLQVMGIDASSWAVGSTLNVGFVNKEFEVTAGDNIVWTEYGWDKLAGTVDLTGYQPKLEFATEISSENASKAVTAGPVKSYVDSEIAKFIGSAGSVLNLVGSGQAVLLHEYVFNEATTFAAGSVLYTASLSSPAYKLMIPAVAFPTGVTLLINGGDVEVPLMDSNEAITAGEVVFTIEVLPDGSVTLMTLNDVHSSLLPIIIGTTTIPQVDTITLSTDRPVTIAAGTAFKIFGWPTLQESDTATSINDMLKEIYDAQEAFKVQTSIPDLDQSVKTYNSVDNLPSVADSGAVAAVTFDSNKSARGMYMFINGKWQRLAFASESIIDGDTVEATVE